MEALFESKAAIASPQHVKMPDFWIQHNPRSTPQLISVTPHAFHARYALGFLCHHNVPKVRLWFTTQYELP